MSNRPNPMRRPAIEAGPLAIAIGIAAVIAAMVAAVSIETAMTARIAATLEQSQ